MKTSFLIFVLCLFAICSDYLPLRKVDLEIDEDTFPIKDDEKEVSTFINPLSYKGMMPPQYLVSIKEAFGKKSINCKNRRVYSGGFYDTFYCSKSHLPDLSKIKLHFKFENSTITLTGKELFEERSESKKDYFFNFQSQDKTSMVYVPTKLLRNKNN